MKKLALIFAFVCFSLVAFSQSGANMIGPKTLGTVTLRPTDSTFTLRCTDNYFWQVFLNWTKNDDSLSVWITQGLDGTNFTLYPGLDTIVTTSATGSISFDDEMMTGQYLKVNTALTDTATYTVKYLLRPRR